MALLGPTRLLNSEKSATYTIKWSYTIIWQVRVSILIKGVIGLLSKCFLLYFPGSFQALLNFALPFPHLTQASIPIRGAMALQVKKAHISVRCYYSFYQALLF